MIVETENRVTARRIVEALGASMSEAERWKMIDAIEAALDAKDKATAEKAEERKAEERRDIIAGKAASLWYRIGVSLDAAKDRDEFVKGERAILIDVAASIMPPEDLAVGSRVNVPVHNLVGGIVATIPGRIIWSEIVPVDPDDPAVHPAATRIVIDYVDEDPDTDGAA
jgi:hypothetical protein